MKVKYYTLMITVILALLGIAIWQTCTVQGRQETAKLQSFETLTPHECAIRFVGPFSLGFDASGGSLVGDRGRKAPRYRFYLSKYGVRTIPAFDCSDFYPQF